MDEDSIFVPIEWLTGKQKHGSSTASCPKDNTTHTLGEQRSPPVTPIHPGPPLPPPSRRKCSPEYYNLCEQPPSPPPPPPPNSRQYNPEYYNLSEPPPSPPPPPRREASTSSDSGFNGHPPQTLFTETCDSAHKLPLPSSQTESSRKYHSAERPPIPLPRHSLKWSASVDYFRTPDPPPSAYNRKLSAPVHGKQLDLFAPPHPPPRNKRSSSADRHSTRELPLPPHTQHVYTTAEQNRAGRTRGYQSCPRGLSSSLSDNTHQQLLSTTTGRINSNCTLENLQQLTHSAPPSPTPTSTRTLFIPTSCAMTSEEVADPQKVTLPQLFMANNADSTSGIAEGSIILVKYTKSTSMVHGRDQDGTSIQMSLNTPATLSPITDECNQRRRMSAEEVLTCKPPPIAVKVMQPFRQKDCTVEQGTLLFLQTTEAVAKGKPRKLRFHDYRGNKIILTAACTGLFSSHPDDVKLFLAELVAKCKFPVNVLFEDGTYSSNIVTLDGVCKQDVLVVQLCNKHDGKPVGQDHELSSHSGLSLVRVALNDKQSKRVMHTTIPESDAAVTASLPQLLACATGTSLMRTNPLEADHTVPVKNNAENHGYTKMYSASNHGVDISGQQRPPWNQSQIDRESKISGGGDGDDDDDDNEDEEYLYVDYNGQVRYTPEQRNIAYLKTLNEADILQLLEAMNMDVYKPIFRREAVDGHLFSELTDEMLRNDLEVQSPLHCLRLGAVIRGKRSAKDLLANRQANN